MQNKNTKISELVSLSNSIRALKLVDLSDRLNKSAEKIINIKTAQYLGIQGYWIRNRRCWENCYRQKRAKKKDLTAQQVWEECHQEYVDSINDDYSGWEKYAEDGNNIKTASKKAKSIFKKASQNFEKSLNNKIGNGDSLPIAIFASINDNEHKYLNGMLGELNKLAEVAIDLKKQGYNGLGEQLAALSVDILKESAKGFGGNWLGDMWRAWRSNKKGQDPELANVRKRFENILSETYQLINDLQNSYEQVQNMQSSQQQNSPVTEQQNEQDQQKESFNYFRNKKYKTSQLTQAVSMENILNDYVAKAGKEVAVLNNIIWRLSQSQPKVAQGLKQVSDKLSNFVTTLYPQIQQYIRTPNPPEKQIQQSMQMMNNFYEDLQRAIQSAYMTEQEQQQETVQEPEGEELVEPGEEVVNMVTDDEVADIANRYGIKSDVLKKILDDLGVSYSSVLGQGENQRPPFQRFDSAGYSPQSNYDSGVVVPGQNVQGEMI